MKNISSVSKGNGRMVGNSAKSEEFYTVLAISWCTHDSSGSKFSIGFGIVGKFLSAADWDFWWIMSG